MSVTGSILAVLLLIVSALVFVIAYINEFIRLWAYVGAGVAALSLLVIFVCNKASKKMSAAGGGGTLGKIGMMVAVAALLLGAAVAVIGLTKKEPENTESNKELKQETKNDLNKLLENLSGQDSTAKDSVPKK
jgi:uncharacterized membrane protein